MSTIEFSAAGVSAPTLTPYEAKRYTEMAEYFIFVRRVIRGLGQRVGRSDPDALRELVSLRAEFEDAITEAVRGLRHDPDLPASWDDIGDALGGLTRQAARKRYGHVGGLRHAGGQPGNWR